MKLQTEGSHHAWVSHNLFALHAPGITMLTMTAQPGFDYVLCSLSKWHKLQHCGMQWRLLQSLWWVTVFPKRYTICSAAPLRAYAEALHNADCFACLRCTLPAFTLLVTVNRTKTCNCWCRLDLHFDTADTRLNPKPAF